VSERRAVITGLGVIAANGIGVDAYWRAARAGRTGVKRITRFDTEPYDVALAGEVSEFEAVDYLPQRLIVQTDRWTWFALVAAEMALHDAGLDPTAVDPYSVGVVTSSAQGGNEFGQREIEHLWARGAKFVGAYQSIAWFYAASTGQISIRNGLKGSCSVVCSEGAGGLDALKFARRSIRRGLTAVVAGGTEAPLGPYALVCQMQSGLLSPATDTAVAYRPFHPEAQGFVPGEGGAFLVVEEMEAARRRPAPQIYGEIAGHCATHDGYSPATPAPDGRQLERAIVGALADAAVSAEEVDLVIADAAGDPEADAIELAALKRVFGARRSPVLVTSPKPMVGRLYSGAAALDVATALLVMRDHFVPPLVNLREQPDGGCLDFVLRQGRTALVETVLVVARGYGGFNSALVLRRVVDPAE
jgi:minimal PKS chain-length factor (CLF/KS beta)